MSSPYILESDEENSNGEETPLISPVSRRRLESDEENSNGEETPLISPASRRRQDGDGSSSEPRGNDGNYPRHRQETRYSTNADGGNRPPKSKSCLQLPCELIILVAFVGSVMTFAYCVPNLLTLKTEHSMVPELEAKVDDMGVELKGMNTSVNNLNEKLSNITFLKSEIGKFNASFNDLEQHYHIFTEEVATTLKILQNASTEFNQSLASMESRLGDFNNTMNAMEKQYASSLAKLEKTLELLENASREFNQSFEEENRKINGLTTKVEDLEKDNTEVEKAIRVNGIYIKQLNESIADLQRRLHPGNASKGQVDMMLLVSCFFFSEIFRRFAT